MNKPLPLRIRPYARLITMLGEQLITNETVALIELIKNSYDADASWVKVSFIDFNEDYSLKETSKIIIEDDGFGMARRTIKKSWLNPATPVKLKGKSLKPRTPKGRFIQGEKGIGRFAIFKLGKDVTVTTRKKTSDLKGGKFEYSIEYNFGKYDDDFLSEDNIKKELFIDDLEVNFSHDTPKVFVDRKVSFGGTSKKGLQYGTRIEITNLKSNWSKKKIENVQREISKMQPIFRHNKQSDFDVSIFFNGNSRPCVNDSAERLHNLLDNSPVLKIKDGIYKEQEQKFVFNLNGKERTVELSSSEIKGMTYYKEAFPNQDITNFGDFNFEFYIFDLNTKRGKCVLDKSDIDLVKPHRVYLYRDDVRVMPYGDANDDWLKIDMIRGTKKADEFLSNDQVVGCIYITQEKNHKLKDKTNREGLIDEDGTFGRFIAIIQILLRYIRMKDYAQYLINEKKKEEFDKVGKPKGLISNMKQYVEKTYPNDKILLDNVSKLENIYEKEVKIYDDRIKKTEDLAAVGLSIETASHDINILLDGTIKRAQDVIKSLSQSGEINKSYYNDEILSILGTLGIIKAQFKDIQKLFPSSKQRTKNINVKDIIDKVYSFYKNPLKDNKITCNIDSTKQSLIVKTTDAVLLQLFINLFDNAYYWLKTIDMENKQILITLDGEHNRLIFSDNGPGIQPEDKDYIFEAFYSGKGESGRGLGLYIARQLLDRYDYTIELAEFSKDKLLDGANFVMEFVKEDGE
ncbi:MAG: ATP-binding protein [Endomicrobia bacterium]|nr:ATP-binding protein [Endomicrobiia bacterium]